MHQPQYRDAITGQYTLPWTYLHAIKDYTDMAAHLEANPAARAVVNFSPVLLEQLEDIAARVAAHLGSGAPRSPQRLPARAAQADDRALRPLPRARDHRRHARDDGAGRLRFGSVHP